MTLRIHPEARREFQYSAAYYRKISRELASRFTTEVEEAFQEVIISPYLHPFIEYPARTKLLHDFPFSIIYIIEPEGVFIVAVMHQKRRPGYWHGRL
ncbi:MAG: type II toxin-antitoxin system RelE/ParE family toxin [Candidatus Kapaibacterium sp.]